MKSNQTVAITSEREVYRFCLIRFGEIFVYFIILPASPDGSMCFWVSRTSIATRITEQNFELKKAR